MKLSRRLVIFLLLAASLFLAGVLFWPFILNEIIKPAALVAWLLLRIFVLSIGQSYYWMAIIFAALVFLARLLSHGQAALPPVESIDSNRTIDSIRRWRRRFSLTGSSPDDEKTLKKELATLLAALYAARQRTRTNFEIYQALQCGQIPLPGPLRTFLFPQEPPKTRRSIKMLLQSIREKPRKWIRRWTGQETAELYRMIEDVLGFMETSQEMNNDEREPIPNED